jgi:hypothetical protein
VVFGLLLAPHRAEPEAIPLPIADARALARVSLADHALAERGRGEPLPGPVRALGSAIRAFHSLEAHEADTRSLGDARRAVDLALVDALSGGTSSLLGLRAIELEAFLEEVRRFTTTGEQSAELQALAGGFVRSMTSEGWCEGHRLVPSIPVLRVMFKQMWNGFLGLEADKELSPTVDEQRELYAFYLSHPHPSRAARDAIAAARGGARTAKACQALIEAERIAVETWRLERIARIAAIDRSYPVDFARGVANYRRGEFRQSAAAFRIWLDGHPDGPLSLRAHNYLRAAVDADHVE